MTIIGLKVNRGNLVNRIEAARRKMWAAIFLLPVISGIAIIGWCRPAKIIDGAIVGMSKSDCMQYAETMCIN